MRVQPAAMTEFRNVRRHAFDFNEAHDTLGGLNQAAIEDAVGYSDGVRRLMDKSDGIAASGMVSAAVLASMVQMLVVKGVLTPEEVHEVYDTALFMLEKQQSAAGSDMDGVYAAARQVIEEMLKR